MGGINSTLYKDRSLISQDQLMKYLNFNEPRALKRFIIKERIPYINVNGKYMVQTSEYDKWIRQSTRIGY